MFKHILAFGAATLMLACSSAPAFAIAGGVEKVAKPDPVPTEEYSAAVTDDENFKAWVKSLPAGSLDAVPGTEFTLGIMVARQKMDWTNEAKDYAGFKLWRTSWGESKGRICAKIPAGCPAIIPTATAAQIVAPVAPVASADVPPIRP